MFTADITRFDENYEITWGNDRVLSSNLGTQIQLSMDASSGSGFRSKLSYGIGFFHLRIKLPDKDSAGVVIAYYLTSKGNKHDELDFEFLGNKEGKPITLQTNVFADGVGDREQRVVLWFDPTADFHNYQILWNQHQIVFYVDDIPIRVFKNNKGIGVGYPSQVMRIEASLWDGDSWATDGGRTKTNWTMAPFKAHFQGFHINGCPKSDPSSNNNSNQECFSPNYWWNSQKYWTLDSKQKGQFENVRRKYVNYDYCSDRHRYPVPPPECLHQ
ncbi:xyloglucan endotransglucosylase/hydrolase protein 2-like isoform X2 [Hibiscus syriacus]|uniref:xyloglucan endotransglucosylase/hydrolase protein 2-like isoform X2 n=1 Tax=Hibiscus syriacus TaxID=106335 RepID=UPI00192371A0|nr:xyloglucan endotransglucosylase/hydrolase protein 2-like isoform X2 [Hibiscus syriacus]